MPRTSWTQSKNDLDRTLVHSLTVLAERYTHTNQITRRALLAQGSHSGSSLTSLKRKPPLPSFSTRHHTHPQPQQPPPCPSSAAALTLHSTRKASTPHFPRSRKKRATLPNKPAFASKPPIPSYRVTTPSQPTHLSHLRSNQTPKSSPPSPREHTPIRDLSETPATADVNAKEVGSLTLVQKSPHFKSRWLRGMLLSQGMSKIFARPDHRASLGSNFSTNAPIV